ncbi:MAG: catalase-related peroxidase [Geminicoccaceae bacterium]|nr:MAG: catalase-related peroxidase [Geminicoccaceae bacterium]
MRRSPAAILLAASLLFGAPAAPAGEATPEALVDALNAVFGKHKGLRASHAKGVCAAGRWLPTAAGRELAPTPLFAGEAPVVARFSLAGGNPQVSDKSRTPRGLAFRVQLAGGGEHDFVLLSAPVFQAKDPETFLGLLRARAPDPATGKPDPEKAKAFMDAHPDTKVLPAWMAKAPITASYATTPYWAIHTFFLTDARGERHAIRWSFVPEAGVVGLSEAELAQQSDDFLADELRRRVAQGPAAWRVRVHFAEPGDSLDDPTATWPEKRRTVEVARLEIREVAPAGEKGACDPLMFAPDNLAEGLAPSADPILAVRTAAYAVSLARRTE